MAWYKKSFGKDYLKIYSHRNREEAKRHVDFACKALNLRAGQLVLDLGCGAGRHSYELIGRHIRVTAFDLSEELLSTIRSKSSGSFSRISREKFSKRCWSDLIWIGGRTSTPIFSIQPTALVSLNSNRMASP